MTPATKPRPGGPIRAGLRLLGTAAARLAPLVLLGFVLFHLLPGDPALAATRGRPTSAAQLAALRHQLGTDRPLPAQFVSYVDRLAHGDLGTSTTYHRPVAAVIVAGLGPTVLLTGTSTVLSVLVGVLTGVRAGWRPGGAADRVSTGVALALWATPTFWLGLLLLVGLGGGAGPLPGLFPVAGMRSIDGGGPAVLDALRHLALPCLTLTAVQYAQYHLVLRASLATERDAPYLLLARAKGLRDVRVRDRHAVPNALLPTLALTLLNAGFVVSGAVAVEVVFSWPGLGYLAYRALEGPDLALLQGTFLLLAASVIVANLLADTLTGRLDPRVRPAR